MLADARRGQQFLRHAQRGRAAHHRAFCADLDAVLSASAASSGYFSAIGPLLVVTTCLPNLQRAAQMRDGRLARLEIGIAQLDHDIGVGFGDRAPGVPAVLRCGDSIPGCRRSGLLSGRAARSSPAGSYTLPLSRSQMATI